MWVVGNIQLLISVNKIMMLNHPKVTITYSKVASRLIWSAKSKSNKDHFFQNSILTSLKLYFLGIPFDHLPCLYVVSNVYHTFGVKFCYKC